MVAVVEPVKRIVAILWRDAVACAAASAALRDVWGDIDFSGSDHPFDCTDYYSAEMGEGLLRRIVSFDQLMAPDRLAEAKLGSIAIERSMSAGERRRVNLDVGYLDDNKLVLASVKAAGQKIYLGQGIYADLVARYRQRRYQPFEWTFPDFRDGRYDPELGRIRARYLEQLHAWRASW
ncbi:MAG: DUF4416 family protein [Pirellulaceae bacterium]